MGFRQYERDCWHEYYIPALLLRVSYQRVKLRYFCISRLQDRKGCLFWIAWKLLDPFCLHLTDRDEAGLIVSAVGAAFFLRCDKSSVLVSGKGSGIVYKREYWIRPSAELRIHHYLFGYNTIVVSLIVFFFSIIISRLLFRYSWTAYNGSNQVVEMRVCGSFTLPTHFVALSAAFSLALIFYAISQWVFKGLMILSCTNNCHLSQVLLNTSVIWLYICLSRCVILLFFQY